MLKLSNLFLVIAVVGAVMIATCVDQSHAEEPATHVTIWICVPDIWIGAVMWDGEPGPNQTYKPMYNLQLREMGKLVVPVEPGWYSFTAYKPSSHTIVDFMTIYIPKGSNGVLDYKDCEEK